ncbi:MAG: hypothetical protein V2I27_13240 [Erythrobacter sp.]|nr:hypothetical protein [Erythrobacter sp.]
MIGPAAESVVGQAVPQPGPEIARDQQDEPDSEFGTDTGGGEPSGGTDEAGNEIVVSGLRLRGQLDVTQAPLLELGEEDIAAEGVASIAELVAQITNQTGSARGRGGGGRPVILVNGIRTGSFRELFQYPPEALAKVEVFPEEVAVRFGFPPDQRVINLILKEDYASREVELEFEGPARGGNYSREQEFGYLKIADGARINLNLTAQDTSLLTENERGILQAQGSISDLASDPDQAFFRSLVPDSRQLEANASWAKAFLASGISVSANANYQRNDSRSLDGLNIVTLTDADGQSLLRTFGADDPLERRFSSDTAAFAGSLTAPVNAFRLTSTVDANFAETTTEIDRRFDTAALEMAAFEGSIDLDSDLPSLAEAGLDTARARTWEAVNLNTLRGPIVDLPAGELLATFDMGYSWNRIDSFDTRTNQDTRLTRGNIQTGANFVIPLTSRRTGVADALGSFTLNAQVGLEELSDFGTLGDYNVSLNWQPIDDLELSATYILREVAPSLANLGNPQIVNLNVPVFDFTNGETVLATVITGGNPELPAETQRDWKFAANWELPFIDNTRLTVEYIRNRSDDVVSAFPQITPAIEAAFPGRITRDETGRLIALDRRSVSFAETRADRLQIQLSTRGSFGEGSGGRSGGGRGGPPRGGEARGGPPASAGGAAAAGDSGDRRAAFMAFRSRACADDGLAFLTRLIEAADRGEDLESILPGARPDQVQRIVSRLRGADATIRPEAIEQFRAQVCSLDPSTFGGAPSDGGAPEGDAGGPQFEALRTRLCGEDGLSEMRALIARIEAGEDVSAIFPGMNTAFIKFALDRVRAPDGTIPDAALEQFRTRICSAQPAPGEGAGSGRTAGGPPGGGGGPAFNPLGGAREGGWRYFANLTHTIELQNEILIAPGVPVLDQLDGDATGQFGLARHSTRLEAGLFGKGVGMRLSGRYTGPARLDGADLPGSTDLFFGDLATFDIWLFTNIDQLTGSDSPLLKNVRVSFRIDNLFDAQLAVRDENGETPINYQPFLIDPVGRFIGVDIRKLF